MRTDEELLVPVPPPCRGERELWMLLWKMEGYTRGCKKTDLTFDPSITSPSCFVNAYCYVHVVVDIL